MENDQPFKRVLLKLSGEALMGSAKYGIDTEILDRVALEIKGAVQKNIQVAIVIGGGNIFRGVAAAARGMDRATGDSMGMLATVMNCLAMSDAFKRIGVENRVMTAVEMNQLAEPYIRLRAVRHLSRNIVTLLAGGTGSPYFTTDTAAALRAAEIGADILFKATKVDGVYDSDPVKNKNAVFFKQLTYDKVLEKHLVVMDATAISLCRENRMRIKVFNMSVPGNIEKALTGADMGTLIWE
jgi:uridylate kinase